MTGIRCFTVTTKERYSKFIETTTKRKVMIRPQAVLTFKSFGGIKKFNRVPILGYVI